MNQRSIMWVVLGVAIIYLWSKRAGATQAAGQAANMGGSDFGITDPTAGW